MDSFDVVISGNKISKTRVFQVLEVMTNPTRGKESFSR